MKKTSKNSSIYYKFKSFLSFLAVLCICAILFSLVSIFCCYDVSFAAEQKSGLEFILPNMVEFIPMLLAFIVVAIILWKFGWPKFEGMLEKRKSTIESALKDSEEKRVEAEKLLEQYKEKLAEAQNKADEILKAAKVEGSTIGSKIEAEARKKAESNVQKAKISIEQSKKTAEQEIKSEAVDIAMSAVEKFVKQDLSDDQHRKLIEDYINEAGSLAR